MSRKVELEGGRPRPPKASPWSKARLSGSQTRPPAEAGFTLMETLVALFILVAATTVLYRGAASGLRAAAIAEGQERALQLAKARLAAAGVETPLQPGVTEGVEDGMGWSVEIRPYGQNASAQSACWVAVTIGWRDQRTGQPRDLRLTTLKLGRTS